MSSMESFYGGRPGASFVIVKRFDDVNIPSPKYKKGYYAIDTNGRFYLEDGEFILKTPESEPHYENWGTIRKDGESTYLTVEGTYKTAPGPEYAEGMIQCFEEGAATLSEVGYGEYVIIDTIADLQEYQNYNNGKIYRRGINGAEYVCQITGLKGDIPSISTGTVDYIEELGGQVRDYTTDEDDGLVPGKVDEYTYNDKVQFGWVNVIDPDSGEMNSVVLGFTFPYLVPELENISRSPYYTQEDYDNERIDDSSLIGTPIEEDFCLFVDNGVIPEPGQTKDDDPTHGDTCHPYYRKWKFEIPKGIKGGQSDNFRIVARKVLKEAPLWISVPSSWEEPASAWAGDSNTFVSKDNDPDIDYVYPYADPDVPIKVEQYNQGVLVGTYYTPVSNTYDLALRYTYTSYDQNEDGNSEDKDVGGYRVIRRIWLAEDGTFIAQFSENDSDETVTLDSKIPWLNGADVDSDGNLILVYNNDQNEEYYTYPGSSWTWDENNHTATKKVFKWLSSADLANDGTLSFTYNDNTSWTASPAIPWLMSAKIAADGTLSLQYNNDTNEDQYPTTGEDPWIWDSQTHTASKQIFKWVTAADLDDDGTLSFDYNDGTDWSAPAALTWIKGADVSADGTLSIVYNNDTIAPQGETWTDNTWTKQVFPWLMSATISDDGTLSLQYNNNLNKNQYPTTGQDSWTWDDDTHTASKQIFPWIKNMGIDSNNDFYIEYNNDKAKPAVVPANQHWSDQNKKCTFDTDMTRPTSAVVLDAETTINNKKVPVNYYINDLPKENGIWLVKATINAAY